MGPNHVLRSFPLKNWSISWSGMAISKYKAVRDKAKTHTAIVQRQHKKRG